MYTSTFVCGATVSVVTAHRPIHVQHVPYTLPDMVNIICIDKTNYVRGRPSTHVHLLVHVDVTLYRTNWLNMV